jgi:hypothetical protein
MSGYQYPSGNLALLNLPGDRRLHVQLSVYFYASTLAKLRQDILNNRSGIATFEVAAPINAPLIHVAMDRRSTYVLGFRPDRAKFWWTFHEGGKALPVLPGGPSRSMGLTGSYTELGLPVSGGPIPDSTNPSDIDDDLRNSSQSKKINIRPERLLDLLASFQGAPDPEFCSAILLLIFFVAEALRFDNVLRECTRYFTSIPSYANTIRPGFLASTVQNWAKTPKGNRNVLVPYLP